MSACFCLGPQPGQPLCPCRMRDVKVINGRYVETKDLGPAPNGGLPTFMTTFPKPEPDKLKGTRVRCPISGADLGPAD